MKSEKKPCRKKEPVHGFFRKQNFLSCTTQYVIYIAMSRSIPQLTIWCKITTSTYHNLCSLELTKAIAAPTFGEAKKGCVAVPAAISLQKLCQKSKLTAVYVLYNRLLCSKEDRRRISRQLQSFFLQV